MCIIAIPSLVWFLLWFRYSGKVKSFGQNSKVLDFLHGKENTLYYFAHWKYGLIPNINSAMGLTVGREKYRPKREIIHGLDGGEIGLDWFTLKGEASDDIDDGLSPDAPILVIEHGLSGGSSERYVQKIGLRVRRQINWRSVCILFRGCCGTKLITQRIYHGGQTEDYHVALTKIHERYPKAPLLLIGFSIGGNVLIKYLGEQFSKTPVRLPGKHIVDKAGLVPNIVCACAVGAPYNLQYCVDHYTKPQEVMIGKNLYHYLSKHEEMLKNNPEVAKRLEIFKKNADMRVCVFDDYFTSLLNGYKDGRAYHEDASSDQYMDGIKTPLLLISAKNDPVSFYGAFPENQIKANPNIAALVTPGGAHLGYFNFASLKTFDEEMALQFFQYQLQQSTKSNS